MTEMECFMGFSLLLLVNVFLIVNGGEPLQDSQIKRICLDGNQMILSGVSRKEAKNLLEKELSEAIHGVLRDEWSKRLYSDSKGIDLKKEYMVGKDGIHSQVTEIGTDSSSGDFFNTIFSRQTSNQVQGSVLSDTSLNVNLAVKQRKLHTKTKVPDMIKTKQLIDKESSSFFEECENMAQVLYDKELLRLNVALYSSGIRGRDSVTIPEHRSRISSNVNSTSINGKIGIGPNGLATYVTHITRGEASNEATTSYSDAQDHGSYKNSKIDLVGISVTSPTDTDPENR